MFMSTDNLIIFLFLNLIITSYKSCLLRAKIVSLNKAISNLITFLSV